MLEIEDENNTAKTLDSECKIHLQESEKLMESSEKWHSQMCIKFNDLCYSVRNRKGTVQAILNNVTGHFEPGKITVILGPSGAGKTTLLKIILGERLIDVKGTVTINNVERNREMIRKQVRYVPQQFDLFPYLTTGETLYIAARLKLDVNLSKQAIYLVVNNIVESCSLSNCLDTLAYKLSGGERRRLSIGVEMITKTSVLLLDEPTSGLDSVASTQLINLLHNVARANCTVVCVIHQPNSQIISLIDDIMVLNRGRCMYCGPKSEIMNTYSSAGFACPNFYNIADFVLEVITEQRGGDLENLYEICRDKYEMFRSSSRYNENQLSSLSYSKQKFETHNTNTVTPTNNKIQENSTWQQQKILFLRALICMKRNSVLPILRFATHVVIGLLFGTVFYNFGDDADPTKVLSNFSYMFVMLVFLHYVNALQVLRAISAEVSIILQEYLNNWYSLRSYYSVKILGDLPMQVLCTTSLLLISYYMTGHPMEYNRILQTWSVCMLFAIIGHTSGMFVGTAFGTKLGAIYLFGVNVPLLLCAGIYVKINDLPVYLQPIGFVSHWRYAFEGLLQAIYLDRYLSCSEIFCYLQNPKKILLFFDMPSLPFYVLLIILSSWILFYLILTYAVLCWKIYYAKK